MIQSEKPRKGKKGNPLPGLCYVGSTTDPTRRIRQHNGELKGGGKCTSKSRPWKPRALFGPYSNRSEAFRAEMSLKRSKRGEGRIAWSKKNSNWCRGPGVDHPWVKNPTMSVKIGTDHES